MQNATEVVATERSRSIR